jgi:DNA-directed RNA polymerase specialized sigma24 family protein
MRRVEGLSRAEIAQRMGIGEDAVSVHLSRAMDALAAILLSEPPEKAGRS